MSFFDVASCVAAGRLQLLKQYANSLVAHWMRRAAIRQLRLLDNCELREIGLSRCYLEAAAHGLERPDAKRGPASSRRSGSRRN